MKNTTSQETSYAVSPSLRVAFKSDQKVERRRKKETKVEPLKSNLPLFNDYRIKAKDHDPL